MSFHADAKIVKDEARPLGRRYMALLHCVENHCPLGFNATLKALEARFGLQKEQELFSQSLIAAIEFLEEDRQAWLKLKQANQELVRLRKRNGFPRTKIVGS